MGKFSRDKGKRNEYLVRDIFREHGWEADRVPSSGAAEGFKGDIRVRPPWGIPPMSQLVEVKARKRAFTKVYEVLAARPDGVCGSDVTGTRFYISPAPPSQYQKYSEFKIDLDLSKLVAFMGPCDILVLKDDHRPPIFLMFLPAKRIQ